MIHFSPRSNSIFLGPVRAVAGILFREKHEKLDTGKSFYRTYCRSYRLLGPLAVVSLIGCTSLKKAALVGTAGLAGVSVGSALGLATAPTALVTAVAASATSVVADQVMKSPTLTGNTTLNNCAPDNFWTAIGTAIELGGIYLIIAFVVVPLLLGWLTPGPLERKKKK
jgi:hypothetical protein